MAAPPPRTPRPKKPPVLPPKPGQGVEPSIRMSTEGHIGRVIMAWSKLEACLDDFIWALLALPIDQGRILTVRMDAVRKIQLIRKFSETILPEETFHQVAALIDQADILREDRNLIAHGVWGRTDPDNQTVVLSLKPEGLTSDQVVTETFSDLRLRKLAGDIEHVKLSLVPILSERYAKLDPSARQHWDEEK